MRRPAPPRRTIASFGPGWARLGLAAALTTAAPALADPAPVDGRTPPTADDPRSLGDHLRAIGAFDDPRIDPRLLPPPPPEHIWPELVAGAGAALIVAGVVGMLQSPTCVTRAGDGRCVDRRGSAPIWPALVVVGLGATVSGSYWYHWTRLPDD